MNKLEFVAYQQKNLIQYAMSTCDFTLSALIANGILANLRNIQDTIIDSLTNIYAGKLNFHLLTPEQLKEEMNTIMSLLPSDLSLPFSYSQLNLPKLYQILIVKARATKKFVIFEIKIPSVIRDNYELYRLIPIPQRIGVNMVSLIPLSEHIVINIQKDSYTPMPETDVRNCINIDWDIHLCPLK